MTRRAGSEYDGLRPMMPAELEEFRKHLAAMDRYRGLNVYREAWYGCRPSEQGLPNGRAVQELCTEGKARAICDAAPIFDRLLQVPEHIEQRLRGEPQQPYERRSDDDSGRSQD